jgi:2-C-methyl-D-erythritol 4-phosphate cytidylyltransferase / 2-C-methyl-D-erythritol 2,4-cyclodiphosphate synthase
LSDTDAVDVIVVAAGASDRMGPVDKVLAPVGGRPLLAWSLDAFAATPLVARIVVVASAGNIGAIVDATWRPDRVKQVVQGHARRQESVAAGIESLRTRTRGQPRDDRVDRVVLVHDGARPLIDPLLIEAVARGAMEHGAAIPVVPITETVKRTDGAVVRETVDRSNLATAQTPQAVQTRLLLEAYERFPPFGPETWTDEASLLEACNIPVHAIPGDPRNLKVTVPADLAAVEAMLTGTTSPRTGFGHDRHRFGPGEPLQLGGLAFAGAPRLHGHSDGDVALHAVADAILGAARMGDLGRLFPADARTERGVASDRLLAEVVDRVRTGGLAVTSIDLTIVGARPRLAGRLDAIGDRIAELVGLPADRVSVKASTGNLEGMEGAGLGIAAEAIATVGPVR